MMRWWPWSQGLGLVALLSLLFLGVAAGAYPVVRRLTRRLEALKAGVELFGAGKLDQRVEDQGRDEVAAVAKAFNEAAGRVETLVRANQSLLANASHELRSPLARMKMAVSLLEEAPGSGPTPARQALVREIHTNIRELDLLVDEVLLASRLDAQPQLQTPTRFDLTALLVQEAARVRASTNNLANVVLDGDERLVRRAVRNLLENAQRHGSDAIDVWVSSRAPWVLVHVADRGAGVPEGLRERIFEPFFRMAGHAEREGGVGLGLSLVKQIAQLHGGRVQCLARAGGGSEFVLTLPAVSPAPSGHPSTGKPA